MSTCPTCGAENPAGFSFCGSCGARLGETAPAREMRKTVTVLFSDITGSTALGEQLDSESLRRMMERYFTVAREVLERHGGRVEKFIGDAVMAVFGIPVVHEDDALRAARAAQELREELGRLNVDLQREFGTELQVRIGVNTGEVVTSEGGTLATGDAVNVAARLEQAAQPGEIYRPAAAEKAARDAAAKLEVLGEQGYLSTTMGILADALLRQGRLEEAEEGAQLTRTKAAEDDVEPQVRWHRVLASIRARQLDFAEADELARNAVEIARRTDWVLSGATRSSRSQRSWSWRIDVGKPALRSTKLWRTSSKRWRALKSKRYAEGSRRLASAGRAGGGGRTAAASSRSGRVARSLRGCSRRRARRTRAVRPR